MNNDTQELKRIYSHPGEVVRVKDDETGITYDGWVAEKDDKEFLLVDGYGRHLGRFPLSKLRYYLDNYAV